MVPVWAGKLKSASPLGEHRYRRRMIALNGAFKRVGWHFGNTQRGFSLPRAKPALCRGAIPR